MEGAVTKTKSRSHLTSFAPQLLVDDLNGAVAFYRDVLGFSFGEPWGGFYAIGQRDGFELHLKDAPKIVDDRRHRRDHEHLDIYAGVDGIEDFHARCVAAGANIIKALAQTAWGGKDFYIQDPEGYILGFGEITK